MFDEHVFRSAIDLKHPERPTVSLQDNIHGAMNAVPGEISGVLKRSSISRWLEITGLPVFSANPAGEARSAPMLATPTTPRSQPTPALTRNRFSARRLSTLQNSARRPSAVRRAYPPEAGRTPVRAARQLRVRPEFPAGGCAGAGRAQSGLTLRSAMWARQWAELAYRRMASDRLCGKLCLRTTLWFSSANLYRSARVRQSCARSSEQNGQRYPLRPRRTPRRKRRGAFLFV